MIWWQCCWPGTSYQTIDQLPNSNVGSNWFLDHFCWHPTRLARIMCKSCHFQRLLPECCTESAPFICNWRKHTHTINRSNTQKNLLQLTSGTRQKFRTGEMSGIRDTDRSFRPKTKQATGIGQLFKLIISHKWTEVVHQGYHAYQCYKSVVSGNDCIWVINHQVHTHSLLHLLVKTMQLGLLLLL